MTVDPIPDGYPQVIPYLCVDGAAAAIDFYVSVFDGVERMRMPMPNGHIGHAEIAIGNALLMLSDEFAEMGLFSPLKSEGGNSASVMLYLADVDAVFAKATAAGATVLMEPTDQFYGDRSGQFLDPFGHRWIVSTHIEDVSDEEVARRMAEMGE